MQLEFIASILGLSLLTVFMVYFLAYHKHMVTVQQRETKQEKEIAVTRSLDKFFEEKEARKAKVAIMAEVDKIRQEMEAKIAVQSEARKAKAAEQIKAHTNESEIIEEAGKTYLSFSESLKSAMPTTEAEKQKDMTDLMDAVKALEMLDKDHYKMPHEDASMDMGKGMLYDTISRKLTKIIKTNNYSKLPFIQAEKLEALGYMEIKNIDHQDFFETLKIMQQIGTIKDIIEINPTVNMIIFAKEPIKFTQAEKVIISFVADADILTVSRLQEKAQWKSDYADKNLKGMINKGYLQIKDENIIIEGMINSAERKIRQEKFDEIRKKEELKRKEQEELALKKAKEEQALKDEKEAQKQKELQEKMLEEARIKASKEAEQVRKDVETRAEEEERIRLEKIKVQPKPMIKSLPTIGISTPSQNVTIQPLPKPVDSDAIKLAQEAKELAESLKLKASKVENIPVPSSQSPSTLQPQIKGLEKPKLPIGSTKIPEPSLPIETEMEFGNIDLATPDDAGFGEGDDIEKFRKMAQQMEKAAQLEEEKAKSTTSKPNVAPLPTSSKPSQTSVGLNSISESGADDDLAGLQDMIAKVQNAQKTIDDKENAPKPNIPISPITTEKSKASPDELSSFFADSGAERITDEFTKTDEIADEVMALLEGAGPRTGGIITIDAILQVLQQGTHTNLKKIELQEAIDKLKEGQIVLDQFNIAGTEIYVFKDTVVFDEEMKLLLKHFVINGAMTMEDLTAASDLDESKVNRIIGRFEAQNMIAKNEKSEYFLPGVPPK